MGAGVAASPHCPFAGGHQAWEARQSAPGGFENRARAGGSGAGAPESLGAGAPRVSPLAPRQGRSPGGSPLADRKPGFPAPAFAPAKPKLRPPLRRDPLGRSLGAAWQVRTEVRSRRFAAPGPKPGPARRIETEAPFRRWQRADLRPASAGRGLGRNPISRLVGLGPEGPRPGHSTKPAAFASAKGQARSFRMAAASSAARASASEGTSAWWDRRARLARAVAGKALDRCRPIVLATAHCCHEICPAPRGIRLWITRITGISERPGCGR